MKVGDVICVADFHDLCPRQVRNFVGNLSWTLSQSRRNGIWVLLYIAVIMAAVLDAVGSSVWR